MRYPKVTEGIFIHRENRFVAQVQIGEKPEIIHVRNTGRCQELLVPGAKVYLEDCSEGKRKTKYSLIGVEKKGLLIKMDSQIPNRVVEEALVKKNIPFDLIKKFKRESTFQNSRFDFELIEPAGFMEVKGVTLEENKIAKFPDAPTKRGEKHVRELIQVKQKGMRAILFFLIQMKGTKLFTLNWERDANFSQAVWEAQRAGVEIYAWDSRVTKDEIRLGQAVPINLEYGKNGR